MKSMKTYNRQINEVSNFHRNIAKYQILFSMKYQNERIIGIVYCESENKNAWKNWSQSMRKKDEDFKECSLKGIYFSQNFTPIIF